MTRFFSLLSMALVRLVINGESWGVYPNQQAFGRQFLRDVYQNTSGK